MRAYLDTNCVIYFVENHPVWCPKVMDRIGRILFARGRLAVGDLTRAECLVVPFKKQDSAMADRYQAFFSDPEIHVLGLSAAICEQAARLRAAYSFKLPDALHLATAIEHGCELFLTNDIQIVRCKEIAVEILV